MIHYWLGSCYIVINAALTISAILSYPEFDLTKTYFLISGVAGINPCSGTLGAVTIPRYVIQVDLQYELDAREVNGTFMYQAYLMANLPRSQKTGRRGTSLKVPQVQQSRLERFMGRKSSS